MTRLKTHCRILLSGFGAIIITTLIAWPVLADFSNNEWRFLKPLQLNEELRDQSLVEMTPDFEVYSHALPGFDDLRIIETNHYQEVPYKLLVKSGELRRESIKAAIKDLRHAKTHTSFVIDLTNTGVLHNEIEIETKTANFQRKVIVEGSENGVSWSVLEDQGRIFDLTIPERSFVTKDTRVRYPDNTVLYLRIKILNDGQKPLQINGAKVFFVQELKPTDKEFPFEMISQREDLTNRTSVILLDFGVKGIPANKLQFDMQQTNFHRKIMLEGSNDQDNWSLLLRSKAIYSFDTPRFVGKQLSISYNESTFRYLRVTVFNEDDQPLGLSDVRAFGFLRQLVFIAHPGKEYTLYYGNNVAESPYYDIEQLYPYMKRDKLPQVSLGTQIVNPLYAAETLPFTERHTWLLPSIIVVCAIAIGLFLANLIRLVRRSLPPPGEQE